MKPMEGWPEEAREAAQLVIDKYGDPDEATDSVLIWDRPGPWKRIVAYRDFDSHEFPAPHNDSVESSAQTSAERLRTTWIERHGAAPTPLVSTASEDGAAPYGLGVTTSGGLSIPRLQVRVLRGPRNST
jgi:hypothetical protein